MTRSIPRAHLGWTMLLIILTLQVGCASSRIAAGEPIADATVIAGDWAGTVTPGRLGVQDPFYLTITPNGQLTAHWASNTAWGTVTIQNGKATFEMYPMLYEGTIRLYEDNGRRTLVLNDSWQPFFAQVRPTSDGSASP